MEKEYAQALLRAKEGGTHVPALVEGLVKSLSARGRMKLLPGILRELKNIEARKSKLLPSIEVASSTEKSAAIVEAKAAGIETNEVTVNHDLIRGWRARSGGTLIDRSGKKHLIELYRNIVTH